MSLLFLSLIIILAQIISIVWLFELRSNAKRSSETLEAILKNIVPPNHGDSILKSLRPHAKQEKIPDLQLPVPRDGLEQFIAFRRSLRKEIDRLTENRQASESLSSLLQILDESLEFCGVQRYYPTIGQSFRYAFGVEENPAVIQIDDEKKHWTIAKVIQPGLILETEDGKLCLQRSQVSVYNSPKRRK